GANIHAKNSKNRSPIDMLKLQESEVIKILQSVEINPNRDEKAALNRFHDENYQELIHYSPLNNKAVTFLEISTKENVDKFKEFLNQSLMDSYALYESRIEEMSEEVKNRISMQGDNFTGISVISSCMNPQKRLEILNGLINHGADPAWIFRFDAM